MPPLDPTRIARFLAAATAATILAGVPLAWASAIRSRRRGVLMFSEGTGREVPWGAGTALAVALLWIGLMNLAIGLAAGAALRGADVESGPFYQLVAVGLVNFLLIILTPRLLAASSRATRADLGLGAATLDRRLREGAAAGLMCLPIVYGVNFAALTIWKPDPHPLQKMLTHEATWSTVAVAGVSGVFLAPAAEELLFRGVLLGWLLRPRGRAAPIVTPPPDGSGPIDPATSAWLASLDPGSAPDENPYRRAVDPPVSIDATSGALPTAPRRVNPWLPNAAVSFAFAMIHFPQWPAPVAIFVLSMGLGALYARTGSVAASFAMHAVFNGTSTLAMILSILSGEPKGKAAEVQPPAFGKVTAALESKSGNSRGLSVAHRPANAYNFGPQAEKSESAIDLPRDSFESPGMSRRQHGDTDSVLDGACWSMAIAVECHRGSPFAVR